RIAGGQHAKSVTAQHIAVALLIEEDGPAIALASRCGLRASEWLEKQPKEHDAEVAGLDISAETAIRNARAWAREYLVDRTVTCDLLLLAVCRQDELLTKEWAACGFKSEELERIVLGPLQELIPLVEQPITVDNRTYRVLDANADRAREALRVL